MHKCAETCKRYIPSGKTDNYLPVPRAKKPKVKIKREKNIAWLGISHSTWLTQASAQASHLRAHDA
jgi:hypothetical protein